MKHITLKLSLFTLFAGIILSQNTIAQDVIICRNGAEKEAVIKKVGVTIIEYVRYDNPDGPVYEIYKDDVFMIQYENGVKDYFELTKKVHTQNNQVNEGLFIDARDSTRYKYIKIGDQVWMGENLRYDDGISPFSPNSANTCDACGRYYKYEDAIVACPKGWHVPTDDEWMALEIEVGMTSSEAVDFGWRGTHPGQAPYLLEKGKTGLDLRMCGFLTQGNMSKKNPWYNNNLKNEEAYYWTSSIYSNYNKNAIFRHFKRRASIEKYYKSIKSRYPVRCIKDNDL